MHYVLKGQMTRRLFLWMLSLSLIPTVMIVTVTSMLRLQEEHRALELREAALAAKADTVFNGLVQNKSTQFHQTLQPRSNLARLLAEQVSDTISLSPLAASTEADGAYATNTQSISSPYPTELILTLGHHVQAADSAIQAIRVYLPELVLVISGSETSLPDSSPETYTTHTIEASDTTWGLVWQNDIPYLIAAAPIRHHEQQVGSVELILDLNVIADEVSSYGLADSALMLLTAHDTTVLAIPSWVEAQDLLRVFPSEIRPEPISQQATDDAILMFGSHAWETYAQTHLPVVFSGTLNGHDCYFAYQAIADLPLSVFLVLPESEVFNTAQSYGARLTVPVLSIISQIIISGIGFLGVVTIGSLISLRQIAEPIHNLSAGAEAVTRGDYTCHVPEDGVGEIAALAHSFNTMTEAVKQSQYQYQLKQDELAKALKIHQQEFQIISDVSCLNNLAADLPGKLVRTLQAIDGTLSIQTSALLLIDENNHPFTVAHTQTPCDCFRQLVTRFQVALAERTLNSNDPLICEALPEDIISRLADCGHFCASAAAVPIAFRNQSLGVLVTYHAESGSPPPSTRAFLPELAIHIAILIENARLQNQTRFLLIADERRNMARELHDSVTQSVFGVSLVAEGLLNQLGEVSTDTQQALEFLVEQSLRARQELRQLINELRPFELGSEGLPEAIENHVRSFKRATQTPVTLEVDHHTDSLPLPIQHNLDRIVQEALSNIARHAQASHVIIRLFINQGMLSLVITDDGQGFEPENIHAQNPNPFGLISMHERTEIMGGQLTIESSRQSGTTIKVVVPLAHLELENKETAHA